MKTTIRKHSFTIGSVTYKGGDFSHNLSGWDVTLEAEGRNITLAIDMSRNDEDGKEYHNSVIDVRQLQADFETVDFVQLYSKPWLDEGLLAAQALADTPALFWLEFTFRDGSKRKAPALLTTGDSAHWFYLYQ